MDEIDRHLKSVEKLAHFQGAVLVEKSGEVVFCEAYNNSTNSIFHIGSLTKQFTAALTVELSLDGKLDLHGKINDYFEGCKEWENITIMHLLSHTSGIPNYTSDPGYMRVAKKITIDKILDWASEQNLNFRPGSEFEYSNTAYVILGVIIEKACGMPYEDFLDEKLLKPAGMNSSGVRHDRKHPGPKAACGYCLNDAGEKLMEDHSENISIVSADGTMYSTVHDMLKWSHVLDGKTDIIRNKTLELMLKPGKNNYGLGLILGTTFGRKTIFHSGSIAGFNCDFCKFPDDKITIIVLSNNLQYQTSHVTGKICSYLFDGTIPIAIPFPSTQDFSPFEKSFRSQISDDPVEFFLTRKERLFLDDRQPAECVLLSNGRLFSSMYGSEYEVKKDGKIIVYDAFDSVVDTLS